MYLSLWTAVTTNFEQHLTKLTKNLVRKIITLWTCLFSLFTLLLGKAVV